MLAAALLFYVVNKRQLFAFVHLVRVEGCCYVFWWSKMTNVCKMELSAGASVFAPK